ncbi:MAG: hypothetical protein JOZ83_00575 [Silvibacterium sp.]|nr:hypothetical protein [Silvibacterium sp.]
MAAEWLTPVKASGVASYLIAAAACAVTAARSADRRVVRLAAVLGALDLVFLLDIAFDWRWKLYAQLRSGAMTHHWYNQRSGPQIAALILIATVLIAAAVWLSRRFAAVRGSPVAICGGVVSIGCWLTEVVSFHSTDAMLYRHAGPLLIVSFLWMLGCGMTAAGIWIAGTAAVT